LYNTPIIHIKLI